MTSSGGRRLEDTGGSLIGARFFKIILQNTLRDKKLLIPGKFVRSYGGSLSKSATLKVPSGEAWTVDVVRDEIGVWFGNGWEEFAEFHSLQFGHFLVFEYEGRSRFSVVICDRTAAEIPYPVRTDCEANGEEVEDSFDTRIRKKSKLLIEVSKSQVEKKKKMRGSISAGNDATRRSWPRMVLPGTQVSKVQCASNSSQADDEQEGESERMISEVPWCSRKCRAMTGFASPHPFFEVKITQTMKQMHVPRCFATSHIAQDEKVVQLQVRDGSSWLVTLNRKKKNKYVMFSGGWDRFVKENSMKPGDVCVFECIRRWTDVLLKVTIVRDA